MKRAWLWRCAFALVGAFPAAAQAANAHGSLGAACKVTADCADPQLQCVTPDSGLIANGGPAGGICTKECAIHGDCRAVDPAAICYRADENSKFYCFESCAQNQAAATIPTNHCHGRADMACVGAELGFQGTFCRPQCASDADCGDLFCNRHYPGGVCRALPVAGDPTGSACEREQAPTTCAGYCGSFTSGAVQCTETCVIGAPGACGAVPGEKPKAACLGGLSGGGTGIGDLGNCLELCSCDSDCSGTGFVCQSWSVASNFAARGTCRPKSDSFESIPACEGEKQDLGACVYGELRACRGAAHCLGTAACKADHSGYEGCVCLDAASMPDPDGTAGAHQAAGGAGSSEGGAPSDGGASPTDPGGAPPKNTHGTSPEAGCACRAGGSGAPSVPQILTVLLLALGYASRRSLTPSRRRARARSRRACAQRG